MKETAVPKKNPKMVSRFIEGETILLPICKTSDDINCIYTLNDCAGRIWELINGRRSIKSIKKTLLEEFNATSAEMDRKLGKFVKEMLEIKAIKIAA